MKWTLSVLAVCFLHCHCAAQVDYLPYYRSIAVAEEAVVNSHYNEALVLYKQSFSRYPYNNPVDCYVAAQLAAHAGGTSECAALLQRGISFGLPLQTISGNPHLASMLSSNALSQAQVDSCRNVYEHRIDKQARAKAIALIQRDQSYVLNYSIYEKRGYRILKPEYQPVWDSLLREVIDLTKSSGFPAQKVIGTMNGEDGLFAISPHSVFAYYIIIHYGNAWPQVGEALLAELHKGNITPQMYGALADYSSGENGDEHPRYISLRPCGSKACQKFLRAHKDQINASRKEIGLCTYEVMEQKHLATIAYKKWVKDGGEVKSPLFDFQPELHFIGSADK
jgi:hypothetical protein